MSFFSNFLGAQVQGVTEKVRQAAIEFDPASASQAQIQTVADAVAQLNHRLAELQINIEGAKRKIVDDESEIHRNMDAAGLLSKKGLDDKAAKILDVIETTLNPKLEGDKKDLDGIQQTISALEARRDELQAKLNSAKSRTENARREMERAKLEAERAHEQELQAKRDAGLIKSVSDLDVASDAMEKAALRARVDAETARRNAASFGGMASPSKSTDPDVAAAFAEASGKSVPTESVAERLAALKAKMAA